MCTYVLAICGVVLVSLLFSPSACIPPLFLLSSALRSLSALSPALVTLLQGCLSGCFRLDLLFSIRMLRLHFLTPGGEGGVTEMFGFSVRFPEFLVSLWLYLAGSCSFFFFYLLSLFLQCLIVASLHWLVLSRSVVPAPSLSSLLCRLSLSSGKVRFLLRLSSLSLVVVLCAPGSFFTLWV